MRVWFAFWGGCKGKANRNTKPAKWHGTQKSPALQSSFLGKGLPLFGFHAAFYIITFLGALNITVWADLK